MNAAGRAPRGGHGVDFYPTPAWAVRAILAAVDLPGGIWMEPSVGSAAWFVWPPGGPQRLGCAPIGEPTGQLALAVSS